MRIPSVKTLRTELKLSQRDMAELLGVSTKSIQSYEQGWRKVTPHIEQMLLLHAILHRGPDLKREPPCWQQTKCDPTIRSSCPAVSMSGPGFCWLVTGTYCHGERTGSWQAKRRRCLACVVLKRLIQK